MEQRLTSNPSLNLLTHIGTWKGQWVWSVLLKFRERKLSWERMMTRRTRCLCVSGPDSAAAARPERCKGWSIGSALHMHPEHPMHHYMHPMHPMHSICTLVHMQGHHCAVLSGSRLSFGGCAQPSGYLVPALDPFRLYAFGAPSTIWRCSIWCSATKGAN